MISKLYEKKTVFLTKNGKCRVVRRPAMRHRLVITLVPDVERHNGKVPGVRYAHGDRSSYIDAIFAVVVIFFPISPTVPGTSLIPVIKRAFNRRS